MKLKAKLFRWSSQRAIRAAEARLRQNQTLWSELQAYLKKSESVGCSYAEYLALYQYVRTHRPKQILECGTGVSTIILAQALVENEAEDGIKGHITSMEDNVYWHRTASQLLPEQYRSVVDIVLSPKVEDHYSLFHGVRYETLPDVAYDMVFVDGPDPDTADGIIVCNLDYIKVVAKSEKPVPALIQNRRINTYVYQKVFGYKKVRLDPISRITYVQPSTAADLKSISSASSIAFSGSTRIWGSPEIHLEMEPEAICAMRRERRYQKKILPYLEK